MGVYGLTGLPPPPLLEPPPPPPELELVELELLLDDDVEGGNEGGARSMVRSIIGRTALGFWSAGRMARLVPATTLMLF